MKKFWILSIPFSIVFLLLELSQLLGVVPTAFLLYVKIGVLFFILLLYVLCSALYAKNAAIVKKKNKNIFYAVSSILLSVSIIIFSIYNVYAIMVLKNTALSKVPFFASPYFYIGYCVLGLLAAIYFCMVSICEFSGETYYTMYPVFALAPPIWLCYGLVVLFAENIAVVSNIEGSIEILALVFSMLFVFMQAKNNAFPEEKPKALLVYSTLGFVFSFAASVAFFAKTILRQTAALLPIFKNAFIFMMALYILAYVATLKKAGD